MENSKQKKVQLDYYDNGVADYEKNRGFLSRGLNRASIRKAKIIASALPDFNGKIVEVGAGSGLVATALVEKLVASEYVLMDLSAPMLEAAKTRVLATNAKFVCGDIAATLFAEGEFDAVAGTDIIHHLEDPTKAMQEWLRICKPNAKLVFLETNALNPLILLNIGVEHEVRCFLNTQDNLKKWLIDAGWNNVKVEPAPSFTPSGPWWLSSLFDLIDRVMCRVPYLNRFAALWLLTAEK